MRRKKNNNAKFVARSKPESSTVFYETAGRDDGLFASVGTKLRLGYKQSLSSLEIVSDQGQVSLSGREARTLYRLLVKAVEDRIVT